LELAQDRDVWRELVVEWSDISLLVKQQMTNANIERKKKKRIRKKKHRKTNHTLKLTIATNDRSDLYLVSPTAARQELEEGETARLVNLATVVSLKC